MQDNIKYMQHRQERHMKASWHTINALKVYWHSSVPVRSICAVPLGRQRSLVSTDTQLFDSLSRLCHVHVGLRLWREKSSMQRARHCTHKSANSHSHNGPPLISSSSRPLGAAAWWIWFQSALSTLVTRGWDGFTASDVRVYSRVLSGDGRRHL